MIPAQSCYITQASHKGHSRLEYELYLQRLRWLSTWSFKGRPVAADAFPVDPHLSFPHVRKVKCHRIGTPWSIKPCLQQTRVFGIIDCICRIGFGVMQQVAFTLYHIRGLFAKLTTGFQTAFFDPSSVQISTFSPRKPTCIHHHTSVFLHGKKVPTVSFLDYTIIS